MLENVELGFIYHEPNDVRESSDDSPAYEYQLKQRLQWQRHRLPPTVRISRAERTFAGNSATNSNVRHTAAALGVDGE
jgi:hypothetical protein